MFISVLISTRNRAASLRKTLELLLTTENLAQSDWEVILMNNNSTDETPEVCQEFRRRYPQHFYFFVEPQIGLSRARNTAIAKARGEILAWIDDDVNVAPDYIQSIQSVCQQYPADGVQGRVLLDCEGARPVWMGDVMARFMCQRDYGDKALEWKDNLAGASMIIRADVYRKLGGYAPELGAGTPVGLGEDSEFTRRMRRAGYRLIYAPQILVRHRLPRHRLTPASFRSRFFDWGRSCAYLEPLPVPLWRFSLYTLKEFLLKEIVAARHRLNRRRALALDAQCEARSLAGFCWQHWLFRCGAPSKLTAPPILPSGHGSEMPE